MPSEEELELMDDRTAFMMTAVRDTYRKCAQEADDFAQQVSDAEVKMDTVTALRTLAILFQRLSETMR